MEQRTGREGWSTSASGVIKHIGVTSYYETLKGFGLYMIKILVLEGYEYDVYSLSNIFGYKKHYHVFREGSFTPVQCSTSHDTLSCSLLNAPTSHAAYASLTVSSFPSSSEDTNICESQPCWQPFICSSHLYSLLGLFFRFIANTSPSLVTPGHLALARENVLSSTMNTYLDHKDTTAFASVNSTLATQPSLLPFPIHEQQPAYGRMTSLTQFLAILTHVLQESFL
ncbi:hypothetical protein PVK06_028293 [Gossypium arboreum]|uniref:Uncharacterized protein n=1 Tax=Gossypium arboreum TaxID=29729 RepID=A0ABR0P2M4_GOSAR|nr:hypothetical protein PVK06_028293 [Gossypium arboreum]